MTPQPITWKNTGIIVGAVAGIIGLAGFALPVFRSDPAPWAGKEPVQARVDMLHNTIHDAKLDIQKQITGVETDIMYNRLFSLAVQRCEAIKRGDRQLAAALAEQIAQWQRQYIHLTSDPLPTRMCSDL